LEDRHPSGKKKLGEMVVEFDQVWQEATGARQKKNTIKEDRRKEPLFPGFGRPGRNRSGRDRAPNGAGKTTLFRMITGGQEQP